MPRHRMLFCSLALFGLIATEARAVPISMTIAVGGVPTFLVDSLATSTATTYNVDAGSLGAINAFLAFSGSEYQLISLGGSSNFPGNQRPGESGVDG